MADKMARRRLNPKKVDKSVIDLQEIIEKYIWSTAYSNEVGKMKAFFTPKKLYDVDIKWTFLDIKHSTREKIRNDGTDYVVTNDKRRIKDHSKVLGKPVSLQKSHYENDTKKSQKFAFSCKRQTKASTSFSFQETYSIGGEVKVEVKVPGDICSVSAGSDGRFTITEGETQTFEDTLAWDVNSEIIVKPGEMMDANLLVREKTTVADLTVTSEIKMKEGKLPYVIRRKSDRTIMLVGELTNLEAPFRIHPLFKDKKRMMFKNDGQLMILKSRGTCKSVSWLQQDIDIHSSKSKKKSDTSDKDNGEPMTKDDDDDDDDEAITAAPDGGDDDDGDDDDDDDDDDDESDEDKDEDNDEDGDGNDGE
ncbi:hypothetical protein LOTGIDRAFT_165075 [Lottia gigantea]|uniref:Uncharacterized protein n=1 Tax=Lottia gigantea TaxID=225164 RepID=V4A876_LOTGI|nr:hypothetical protein LOTGIDRAFT_165075 [Lottia gigantea]ESO89481.1 hypothetical protein LOTGIDRAFT_165075 [Lottia gigantea]